MGAGVDAKRATALADVAGLGPVGVFVGGESIFTWGDLDRPSFVASARKSVLSVAFGRLVADGRLDLDATLADLDIDDITPLSPTERSATVRHLLQAFVARSLRSGGRQRLRRRLRLARSLPLRGAHLTRTPALAFFELDPALRGWLRDMRALRARWWMSCAVSGSVVGTVVAVAHMVFGDVPAADAALRGGGSAVVSTLMLASAGDPQAEQAPEAGVTQDDEQGREG